MKLCFLFVVAFAIVLPAIFASRPNLVLADKKTLSSVQSRSARLLRRLRARQDRLSVEDGSVALTSALSATARSRLLKAQKMCLEGNKKACSRSPMLMRRSAILRRSARKALEADVKRKEQLSGVEMAIKIAVRYNYHPSSDPRPEDEPEDEHWDS